MALTKAKSPKPLIQFEPPLDLGTKAIDSEIEIKLKRSERTRLWATASIESAAFAKGVTVRFGPRSDAASVKVKLANAGKNLAIKISSTDSDSQADTTELKVTVEKARLTIEAAAAPRGKLDELRLGDKVKITVERHLELTSRASTFRLSSGAFASGKVFEGAIPAGQKSVVVEVTVEREFEGKIELKPSSPADEFSEIGAKYTTEIIKVLAPRLEFDSSGPAGNPHDLGEKPLGELTLKIKRSYAASFASKAEIGSSAFADGKTYPAEIAADKSSAEIKVELVKLATDPNKPKQDVWLANPVAPTRLGDASKLEVTVKAPQVAFTGGLMNDNDALSPGGKFWRGLGTSDHARARVKVVLDAPAPKGGAKAKFKVGSGSSQEVAFEQGQKEVMAEVLLKHRGSHDLVLSAVSGCVAHSDKSQVSRKVVVKNPPNVVLTREDKASTPFQAQEDEIELRATLSDEAPLGGASVKIDCPELGIPETVVEFEALQKESTPATFKVKAGKAGIDQPIKMSNLVGCALPANPLELTVLPVARFHAEFPLRPKNEGNAYTHGEKARVTVMLNVPALASGARLLLKCGLFDDAPAQGGPQQQYELSVAPGASRGEKVVQFKADPAATAEEDFEVLLEPSNDPSGDPQGALVPKDEKRAGKLMPLPKLTLTAGKWIDPADTADHLEGGEARIRVELDRPAPNPDGATFSLCSDYFAEDYPVVVEAGKNSAVVQVNWTKGHATQKADVKIVVGANDRGCRSGDASTQVRQVAVKPTPAVVFNGPFTIAPASGGGTAQKPSPTPQEFPTGQAGALKIKLVDSSGKAQAAPVKALFKIRSKAFGTKVYRAAIAAGQSETTVNVTLDQGSPTDPVASMQIKVEPVEGCVLGEDTDTKRFIWVKVKDGAQSPGKKLLCRRGKPPAPPEVRVEDPVPCNQVRLLVAQLHGEGKDVRPERGESARGIFEFMTGSRTGAKYADAQLSGNTIQVIAGGKEPAGHAAHTTWVEVRGDDGDKHCKEDHVVAGGGTPPPKPLKHPHVLVSFSDGLGRGTSMTFPPNTWSLSTPIGGEGVGSNSGHENARLKKPLQLVRLYEPPHPFLDLVEKKGLGLGIPFGSAFRAISVSKRLVKTRRYRIETVTCGDAGTTGARSVRSLEAGIEVFPSDEFALSLTVRPVPAMHWGYTGRFVGDDGKLREPGGGAGGDSSIKDYVDGEDFGAHAAAGGSVSELGSASKFGEGLDKDAWNKQYEEGSERSQATLGDMGGDGSYSAATTLDDRGLAFLNTVKEKPGDFFKDDANQRFHPREVRKKRKGSLSFHAGAESEYPSTWEDANALEDDSSSSSSGSGTGGKKDWTAVWSEYHGEDAEGTIWLAPPQVRDRFTVSLTHNGEKDPQWDSVASTINTLISAIKHFEDLFSKLQDMVPSYGLGFQLSMGFLEGDLTYRWGWKEHTDRRVFLWKELSAEVMLFRLSLRLDFGARWAVLVVKFEAIVYAQLVGELKLAGHWQITEPDGKLGFEDADLSAPCKVEAGVNIVLVHEHVLHVNGAIKTGIEFKFQLTFEEEFLTEYERRFLGLSVSATFKLIGFNEVKKEKYLVEGDPPGLPAVRKVLFPRSQVGGYLDVRSNLALLWRKLGIEYAKLQGALDAWHDLQMEIVNKRAPGDPDPPAAPPAKPWPYTGNPGHREVDFSITGDARQALTESPEWADQWKMFTDAIVGSQGDWLFEGTGTARKERVVKKRHGLTGLTRKTDTLRGRLMLHVNAMDELVASGVKINPVPRGWGKWVKVDLGLRDTMVRFHDEYFRKLRELDQKVNELEDEDPGLPVDDPKLSADDNKKARSAAVEQRNKALEPVRTELAELNKKWLRLRPKPSAPLSAREETRQVLKAMDAGMTAIRHYHTTYIESGPATGGAAATPKGWTRL